MRLAETPTEAEPGARVDTFDLPQILSLLRLRWKRMVMYTLACGLLIFALSFLLRPVYKATTIVLPPDKGSGALSLPGMALASGMGSASALEGLSGLKKPADLYVALLSTPGVEDAIVKQFKLMQLYRVKHPTQARTELEQNTRIVADSKSGLITIAVSDHDPDRAAAMANSFITVYDKVSAGLAITEAQRRRLFLEKQVGQTRLDLAQAEDSLKGVSERTGVLDVEGDARSMIGFEATLRAQIATKSVRMQSMKSYMAPENPELQTAQRELEALQGQAGALSAKTSGGAFASRKGQTEASLEYTRGLRELRYQESLFELLSKNLEMAKLDEAREGNALQVVQPATAPDMKDGPHRSLFLAGGLVLGALLSAAWVIVRDGVRLAGTRA